MTFTISLHWWYLPIAMFIAGCILLGIGERPSGMFGGMLEGVIACCLIVGAIACGLTGWMAS
jgi:hypothetical protein